MVTPEEDPVLREKPLNELLSRSMVDIYVGPENTHWILHEKLLCTRSSFFRGIFYNDKSNSSNKSFGLPEDDDAPFRAFVGWLYSGSVPAPHTEADLAILFDLFLMGERWSIPGLRNDSLEAVRAFYAAHDSYPGLRRVQYVYANTEDGSAMRMMLVRSIARMLAISKQGIPQHWDKALRKNGQLAVDIIRAVQEWQLDGEELPDARSIADEGSDGRSESSHMSLKKKMNGIKQEPSSAFQTPIKKEALDGATRNQKDLNELPNGLVNGIPNGS